MHDAKPALIVVGNGASLAVAHHKKWLPDSVVASEGDTHVASSCWQPID